MNRIRNLCIGLQFPQWDFPKENSVFFFLYLLCIHKSILQEYGRSEEMILRFAILLRAV